VRCNECGADLPGDETCTDRFGALLAAEYDENGNFTIAARVHGLTVMTFYLQHAGGIGYTKRYQVEFAERAMRRLFVGGEKQEDVFPTDQRAARQRAATDAKAAPGAHDSITQILGVQPGELTVASLDPANLDGHYERVMTWARSVAEHRVLNVSG
jgi:Family of unknown function (DUF5946)